MSDYIKSLTDEAIRAWVRFANGKRPGLSVARRLAHEERARRNCEELQRQIEAAPPVERGDKTVTVRVRTWTTVG